MIRATLMALLIGVLLSGCRSSSTPSGPAGLFASGYLTEEGSLRLWRQDSQGEPRRVFTFYSPFSRAYSETTDYHWQESKLIAVEQIRKGKQGDVSTTEVRFDSRGELIFMQRQQAGRRESLTAETVSRLQFEASRLRESSDDLRRGDVVLRQAQWTERHQAIACQGEQQQPQFNETTLRLIDAYSKTTIGPRFIAWLEGPEKTTQLLLLSSENLCQNEPDKTTF
ncbi:MAG: hypothetical protein XXXJIFNMEKO3_03508 [Candidatus Erwinia impunctatus]|nr:hypothetical protein XXXJIFNMEKO_03508 [Culicoides impunctatus]